MDGMMAHWKRLLLASRVPGETLAILEVLRQLLLTVDLPELERLWLRHDFGCLLFEVSFAPSKFRALSSIHTQAHVRAHTHIHRHMYDRQIEMAASDIFDSHEQMLSGNSSDDVTMQTLELLAHLYSTFPFHLGSRSSMPFGVFFFFETTMLRA